MEYGSPERKDSRGAVYVQNVWKCTESQKPAWRSGMENICVEMKGERLKWFYHGNTLKPGTTSHYHPWAMFPNPSFKLREARCSKNVFQLSRPLLECSVCWVHLVNYWLDNFISKKMNEKNEGLLSNSHEEGKLYHCSLQLHVKEVLWLVKKWCENSKKSKSYTQVLAGRPWVIRQLTPR